MSRNKAVFICLLVIAASALLSGSALIDEDMMTEQTFNYKTAAVERGTFEKNASMSAMVYYTREHSIRYHGSAANFVKYLVKQGKEVKKGDTIAVVTVKGSRVELETMKKRLARAEKDYEKGLAEQREAIQKTQRSASETKDATEAEVLRLQCEKQQIDMESYVLDCEYQIDTLKRSIAKMEENFSATEITAEYDGTIEKIVTSMKEGNVLYDGTSVGKLQDPKSAIIVARDDGKLRYGMDVVVTSGAKTQRTEYRGRVIAADNILPYELRTGYAAVEILDEWDPEKMRNPYINYKLIELGNVLTIPKWSASLDKGNYYVSILEGNTVKKRVINFSLYSADRGIVLQGLEEGELVILN